MNKYCYFDDSENVIAIDLSDLSLTQTILDQLTFEVIELTKTLPDKVFAIIKWHNVKIPSNLNDKVGNTMSELLNFVNGLVRYETDEPTPFHEVISSSEKHVFSSSPKSKAAALASVRALESRNKP